MKHTPSTLFAASLVAGCLSVSAWAADNAKTAGGNATNAAAADAQQGTQPSVQNMDANAQRAHSKSRSGDAAAAQQGNQPSAENMDANAQRAHSRSRGTEPGNADAAKSKGATGGSDSQSTAQGGTRDWGQVDTNHDNVVSPEEMQTYLDQSHGQKSGSSTSSGASTSSTPTTTPPAAKQ